MAYENKSLSVEVDSIKGSIKLHTEIEKTNLRIKAREFSIKKLDDDMNRDFFIARIRRTCFFILLFGVIIFFCLKIHKENSCQETEDDQIENNNFLSKYACYFMKPLYQ